MLDTPVKVLVRNFIPVRWIAPTDIKGWHLVYAQYVFFVPNINSRGGEGIFQNFKLKVMKNAFF